MTDLQDHKAILGLFFEDCASFTSRPHGNGHIHKTFLVENGRRYILQRINHHIFPDLDGLMHNIWVVTRHLQKKGGPCREFLVLHPARDGLLYAGGPETGYWRLYDFIPGSQTFDKPADLAMTEEGGRAFGRFNLATMDLDPGSLHDLLPGFHDLGSRWRQFQDALSAAPQDRFREASHELRTAEQFFDKMTDYFKSLHDPAVPLRITHNDTKFNNILFNHAGEALCVIDLDTVMPGYLMFDYGDALRTVGNTTDEDERDSCRVRFDFRHFQAFTRGYLSQLTEILTARERDLLAYAPAFITYLQGLRFLTDHLNQDRYYPVRYFGHNLVRAAVQFTLLKGIDDKADQLDEFIRECC